MEDVFGPGGGVGFAATAVIGALTPEKRKLIAEGLKGWIINDARKKVVLDLPELIVDFGKRIDRMVENLDIQIVDNKPVVKAVGSGETTLRALERGTNWFDPCDDVVSVVISSLWKS